MTDVSTHPVSDGLRFRSRPAEFAARLWEGGWPRRAVIDVTAAEFRLTVAGATKAARAGYSA